MKKRFYKFAAIVLTGLGLAGSVYLKASADVYVPENKPKPKTEKPRQEPKRKRVKKVKEKPKTVIVKKVEPKRKKVVKQKPQQKRKETVKVTKVEKVQPQSVTQNQTNRQSQNTTVNVSQNVTQPAPAPVHQERVVEKQPARPIAVQRPTQADRSPNVAAQDNVRDQGFLPETGVSGNAPEIAFAVAGTTSAAIAYKRSKKALKQK